MSFTEMGLGSQCARNVSVFSARRFSFAMPTLLGAVLICSFQSNVVGAPINYGSHVGTTVSYVDVSEESTTGDSVPLFGAPIFSADSVDFNPVGFDATAAGAGGSDTTGSRLTFNVNANAGNAVNNISFHEAGQTTLSGSGTDATSATVTASGTLTINAIDGAAITPIVRPIALAFSPSGGTYGLATGGGGLPFFNTPWSGALAVDVAQILTQENMSFILGATGVSIDLTNTLSARSETNTHALISKQDFGGISVTVNGPGGGGGPDIPEPASLMLAALAGLLGVCIRQRDAR